MIRAVAPACSIGRRFGAALLLLLALCGMVQAQATRVGFVDMKRLLDAAPQLQESRQKIEREFASRDGALKSEEARLAELERTYANESALAPKAVADAAAREIEALRKSIERTRKRLRDEVRVRSDQEVAKQWPIIEAAVLGHAREQNLDLVVRDVMYASPRIDITDAVLARLRRDAATAAAVPQ